MTYHWIPLCSRPKTANPISHPLTGWPARCSDQRSNSVKPGNQAEMGVAGQRLVMQREPRAPTCQVDQLIGAGDSPLVSTRSPWLKIGLKSGLIHGHPQPFVGGDPYSAACR